MIRVMQYSSRDKAEWDNFIVHSKNATFLFFRDYMDYHSDRFEDCSLIIKENEEVLGLLPANRINESHISTHSGLTYGGFIVRKNAKLKEVISIFLETLKYCVSKKIIKITYKSFPRFYNTIGSDEVDYALFLLKAKLIRRDCALAINLNEKLEFQDRRKRSIKKGKNNGIVIKEDKQFNDFWDEILIPNLLSRFGKQPVHSLEEISLLANAFPPNIRQFNAYLDGKIIAGTTIFETKNVAHAQYISANGDGRNLGALDLLFSELIEGIYSNKNYFDFGISNENNGLTLNHGLLEWKEGFGGRSFSHDFYELDTRNYQNLHRVLND